MKVQLLMPEAKVPTRATPGAAGLDLYSVEDLVLYPGCKEMIETGVAIELAEDEVGMIWPRSGLAAKYAVDVLGGVVDNDYRNGVAVVLINHGERKLEISCGDRIAQLVVQKCSFDEPQIVEDLSKTERGIRGFGSTG